jgi:hypothetical protein
MDPVTVSIILTTIGWLASAIIGKGLNEFLDNIKTTWKTLPADEKPGSGTRPDRKTGNATLPGEKTGSSTHTDKKTSRSIPAREKIGGTTRPYEKTGSSTGLHKGTASSLMTIFSLILFVLLLVKLLKLVLPYLGLALCLYFCYYVYSSTSRASSRTEKLNQGRPSYGSEGNWSKKFI